MKTLIIIFSALLMAGCKDIQSNNPYPFVGLMLAAMGVIYLMSTTMRGERT